MTWYADLSPCDYYGDAWTDSLTAVGWLEPGRDYSRGCVEGAFLRRLQELCAEPGWAPGYFLGMYQCELCPDEQEEGQGRPAGSHCLFVPSATRLYVAPALIAHYVADHGYQPPAEFCDAVMRCPPPGTEAYLAAIEALIPAQMRSR